MKLPIYQVDAFTDKPFQGNPAAVVLLETPAEAGWMRSVAAEMNLSETAFVCPQEGGFNMRWFTPKVEVELCGHATLASAHVLWESGMVPADHEILFLTRSGRLPIRKEGEFIQMDFPAAGVTTGTLPEGVLPAIGAQPSFIGVSGEKWLLEFADESIVRSLALDFAALRSIKGRGLIATSRSSRQGVDFVSRYFAPWVGIDEDPVTGSAHTILALYWAAKLGKSELVAQQVSSRGGTLRLQVSGNRVLIAGRAVTVFRGELFV